MVAAALGAGCRPPDAEDRHDGQTLDGRLVVRNPFAARPSEAGTPAPGPRTMNFRSGERGLALNRRADPWGKETDGPSDPLPSLARRPVPARRSPERHGAYRTAS